jgi:sec-independent protein translocase protein TatB
VFNLSGSEVVFILLAALVVLGPEKLPGAIRQFGRIYSELRKMGQGFQSELKDAFDEPMRELRETADLAKSSVMNPLGEDGPNLADIKPRSISDSVRRMLEGTDAPATAAEMSAADRVAADDDIDPVLAADAAFVDDDPIIPDGDLDGDLDVDLDGDPAMTEHDPAEGDRT